MIGTGGAPFPGAFLVASAEEVEQAYGRLAGALQGYIDSDDCVLLAVMLGGMVPAVRIAGLLRGSFVLDYCHITRYKGGLTGGSPDWLQPPRARLSGRTVLIVDDIFDEGVTLQYVVSKCRQQGAGRVISAVLLRKEHERVQGDISPDFAGLTVADDYVFGCGMDYRERWRNLPAIYAIPADFEGTS